MQRKKLLKKIRKIYFEIVVTLFLLFYTTALCAAEFTFIEAWKRLLASSDKLAAQKSAVERQEHLQKAAKILHLPHLSVSGNYTHFSEPLKMDGSKVEPFASIDPKKTQATLTQMITGGIITPQQAGAIGNLLNKLLSNSVTKISDEDVFTSNLLLTWPIFTGGRIMAAGEIAEQQTVESKELLALLRKQQFVSLVRTYFGVVLAQKVLETRQEAENGLRIHHRHALAMEKEGQIARVERLKAQAALDRAIVATGKARRTLEVAVSALSEMLQQNKSVTPVNPLFVSNRLPPQNEFLYRTLETHPGLKILKSKEAQAKALVKIQRGEYFPQIAAFGSYNLYKPDSLLGDSMSEWLAGVGVSLTIFDNKGRLDRLQAAKASCSQASHLYRQINRDLSVLVEKRWKETMQAKEEFFGLRSSIALAEENVRLQEKGFSQGLFTSLDVVDARLFLESVKTQQLVASYNYVVALADLLSLSGQAEKFSGYQAAGGGVKDGY